MPRVPRVLLVGAEDEENLALRYLAAVLQQQDARVEILPFARPEDAPPVLQAVQRRPPDLIGLSLAFQCLAHAYFGLVAGIRRRGYRGHITVGGHFPTFEYQRILETQPGIDSVGRFEGERTITALARAVTDGGDLAAVPNLVYRAAGSRRENPCTPEFGDLDALPFPLRRRRPHVRLGERFATLVTSRGCWHSSCLYCCIGAFHRDKPQPFALREATGVARELAWLYRRQGVRLFQFHDDNFVLATPAATLARLRALRVAIAAEGLDLRTLALLIKARPDAVDDAVARELAELGAVGVFLGIENASPSGLRALIRGTRLEDVHTALAALQARGLVATYNLLIFHPHATFAELDANLEFVRGHLTLPFDFGRAEIVAGSPLERLVVHEQRRRGEWPEWD